MRKFLSTLIATAFATALSFSAVAGVESSAKELKTQPISSLHVSSFIRAVTEVELANKTDRAARMQELEKLAIPLKADISRFVAELKANNEVKVFDAIVLAEANKVGGKKLNSEIRAAGGAVAILGKADSYINQDIQLFKSDLKIGWMPSWSELFGIADAQARIGQTVCGVFFWVVTAGYGHGIAYHYCYK